MKKINLGVLASLVALFLASVMVSACAFEKNHDSNKVTSRVGVADFKAISASTGVKVVYTQGALSEAVVTAPAKVMDRVVVRVEGGVLVAKVKPAQKWFGIPKSWEGDVTVRVSAPSVGRFTASSGADIECKGGLKMPGNVMVEASSSGDVEFGALSAAKVSCAVSSGADIEVKSLTAAEVNCSASSGANIEIEHLKAEQVRASASSGADIEMGGTADVLSVSVSSGADFGGKRLYVKECSSTASSGGSVSVKAENARVNNSSGGSFKNCR